MSRELKEVGKSEDTCQCASLFPAKVWAHLDRTRGELVQTAAEEAPEVCMEKKKLCSIPQKTISSIYWSFGHISFVGKQ